MPLKHALETRLIVLLGIVLIVAGGITSILPPLYASLPIWIALCVLFVAYPISLLPVLRRDRADKVFRLLHWSPAGTFVLWVIAQCFAKWLPAVASVVYSYTWLGVFIYITISFILLIYFCLHVIRRRLVRVPSLLVVFEIFVLGMLLYYANWMPSGQWGAQVSRTGVMQEERIKKEKSDAFGQKKSYKTAQTQQVVFETHAGEKLSVAFTNISIKEMPRYNRDRKQETFFTPKKGVANLLIEREKRRTKRLEHLAPKVVNIAKTHLPKSGPMFEMTILLIIALYCGVLHDRARRRV